MWTRIRMNDAERERRGVDEKHGELSFLTLNWTLRLASWDRDVTRDIPRTAHPGLPYTYIARIQHWGFHQLSPFLYSRTVFFIDLYMNSSINFLGTLRFYFTFFIYPQHPPVFPPVPADMENKKKGLSSRTQTKDQSKNIHCWKGQRNCKRLGQVTKKPTVISMYRTQACTGQCWNWDRAVQSCEGRRRRCK
jgi:hypothetical protein